MNGHYGEFVRYGLYMIGVDTLPIDFVKFDNVFTIILPIISRLNISLTPLQCAVVIMPTPALKQFFTSGMPTSTGEEVSTGELKNVLKEIIAGEDKKNPLTDDELVDILQEKGYQIARRTISKYRQMLLIPVARLRREV